MEETLNVGAVEEAVEVAAVETETPVEETPVATEEVAPVEEVVSTEEVPAPVEEGSGEATIVE